MANTEELKKQNMAALREVLYDGSVHNKAKLMTKTGLSSASVTYMLQEMEEEGEIRNAGDAPSTGGRKSKQYILNKDYRHILSVILSVKTDGYEIAWNRTDLMDNVLDESRIRTSTCTVAEITAVCKEQTEKDPLLGIICISHPGVSIAGRITISDINALQSVCLEKQVQAACRVETIVENDVNVAAIAFQEEYPASSAALLYQPSAHYIGVGIIIHGRLYNGASHFAGELSYLPFYTKAEQDCLLKENPTDLLAKQLAALNCVLNPEVTGVCSEAITEFNKDDLLQYIPAEYQPRLVEIRDLYTYIQHGLTVIAKKNIRERRGTQYDKKLH